MESTCERETFPSSSYAVNQMVVDDADAGAVVGRLRRLGISVGREPLSPGGVSRLRLLAAAPLPVPDLVAALRAADPRLRVAPNHLLRPASHVHMVATRQPEPAPPLDDLPTGEGLPGEHVTVGVIDSGFCPHAWFGDRVQFRPQDVEAPPDDTKQSLPFATGHGTFVAGVILQRAPGARVVARRILDEEGHMTDASLATALADMEHVDIVNLSLGTTALERDDALALLATANSLFQLWKKRPDMVVVAPAGNDGGNVEFWPAKFDPVVAVAALNAAGTDRAEFSNFGDWVDSCSKGEDVHSRFLDWAGDVQAPPLNDHGMGKRVKSPPFDGWAIWDGTSFSAARVTGAIAAALDKAGGMTGPAAVEQVLQGPRPFPGCGAVVD